MGNFHFLYLVFSLPFKILHLAFIPPPPPPFSLDEVTPVHAKPKASVGTEGICRGIQPRRTLETGESENVCLLLLLQKPLQT